MAIITSQTNEKLKRVRALQDQRRAREEQHAFVVEGVRLLEAALDAGALPEFVLYDPALANDARAAALLTQTPHTYAVAPELIRAAADTQTPQGVLAVFPIPRTAMPSAEATLLIVDGVRDPGNLGTLLRAAAAAGLRDVLLAPGTVDVYNPKVVRGAMGAHFRLALHALAWSVIATLRGARPTWLAATQGGVPPWQADLRTPCCLIVGGEASGASVEASELATGQLTLPLAPGVESLNAGVAAAIILFEMVRQRTLP